MYQMKQEKWLPVVGFEGHYEVSNLGKIKSVKTLKEKILCLSNNGRNYLQACLYKDKRKTTRKAHTMVSEAFLNHKSVLGGLVVDHIDNNRKNNHVENLQIISNRENSSKDKKNKTSKYVGVCWSKADKKWISSIKYKRKTIYLGRYNNEETAHIIYQKALKNIALCDGDAKVFIELLNGL